MSEKINVDSIIEYDILNKNKNNRYFYDEKQKIIVDSLNNKTYSELKEVTRVLNNQFQKIQKEVHKWNR